MVRSDEDLVRLEKVLVRSDEGLVGLEKVLVRSDEGLVGLEKVMVRSDEGLVGLEKVRVGSDEALVRLEKVRVGSDEALFQTNTALFQTAKGLFAIAEAGRPWVCCRARERPGPSAGQDVQVRLRRGLSPAFSCRLHPSARARAVAVARTPARAQAATSPCDVNERTDDLVHPGDDVRGQRVDVPEGLGRLQIGQRLSRRAERAPVALPSRSPERAAALGHVEGDAAGAGLELPGQAGQTREASEQEEERDVRRRRWARARARGRTGRSFSTSSLSAWPSWRRARMRQARLQRRRLRRRCSAA